MRVKIKLNTNRRELVQKTLLDLGVEICEDADLILTEDNYSEGEILCRKDEDYILVSMEDILYVETLGKSVFVHVGDQKYTTKTRLYELERTLPEDKFIRISNSVIISRNAIKKIRPTPTHSYSFA